MVFGVRVRVTTHEHRLSLLNHISHRSLTVQLCSEPSFISFHLVMPSFRFAFPLLPLSSTPLPPPLKPPRPWVRKVVASGPSQVVGVVFSTAGRVLPLIASRRVGSRATPRPAPASASSREHLPTARRVADHLPCQVGNAEFPARLSSTPSRGSNVFCLV